MAEEIWVVKETGEKEKFSIMKVKRAIRRSGLSPRETEKVLSVLLDRIKDGMTTKQIYSNVFRIIRELRPEASYKYNLKHALQLFGPAGYDFEIFVARLFESLGYATEFRQIPQGKCITHETDVIAIKGKERIMAECKFRNEPGKRCRIQTALYIYARYLDLRDGAKIYSKVPFTQPCLVTNAKFSGDVIAYADCIGMRLIGWKHPLKGSIECLIDKTKCYPVSVINMKRPTLQKLIQNEIITVQDVPDDPKDLAKKTGISLKNAQRIVEEAKRARK